jgi:hypothetical protein
VLITEEQDEAATHIEANALREEVVVTAGGWDRRGHEMNAQHNVYLMAQRL